MKPLLILIPLIVAVAHGKPGVGYSYPTPTPSAVPSLFNNFATPSPSLAPSLFNLQPSPTPFHLPAPSPSLSPSLLTGAGQYGPPLSPHLNFGGQSFGSPSLGLQSFGGLGGQSLGLGGGFDFGQSGFNFGGQFLPLGSPQLSVGSPQLSFGTPSLSITPAPDLSVTSLNVGPTAPSNVHGSTFHNAGGIVQKHVYFHVAPEEPDERPPPKQVVFPPPRRQYRIIFIKAPPPPTPTAPIIHAPAQDDERTLVYVLVKKPEPEPEIKVEAPPPTTPSKPEVYFIRYDTRKESFASGAIPSGPVSAEGSGPILQDVIKGGDLIVPSVRIGGSGHSGVELNLNKASLSGGSALSLAVTGSPLDNGLQISSTPVPKYGPPEHK